MLMHRFNPAGTGYVMNVNGKEKFVDRVVVFNENGPVIISGPSSMSNTWPYTVELPNLEVVLKRKADFSQKRAFVLWETVPGFTSRYILYLPAESIGLSEPVFIKDEENMCFIEIRTTVLDGFEFRTYHFINAGLIAIDEEISEIGSALRTGVWRWDLENPLSKYIARLNKLSLDREAELQIINNMTADDLVELLKANKEANNG